MSVQMLDEKRFVVYWDEKAHIHGPAVELKRAASAKDAFPEDDGWDAETVERIENLSAGFTVYPFCPVGIVAVWRVK